MSDTDQGMILSNIPEANIYVFPAYWGGVTRASQPPQIHAALKDLRRAVGSLSAKKQQGGPMFPVRSAKELMQKLAEALDELNLHAYPVSQEVHHFDTANIPSNATASGKPVFRTLAHVKSTVRVGASDGSFVDMVGSGHGGDVDDKAGGKADTYAWKSALLKGLSIPEQDMPDTDDEAPSEPTARVNQPKVVVKTLDAPGPDMGPGKVIKAPSKDGGSTLASVMAQVEAADEAGLDELKGKILSGEIPLAGADKLRVSAAFVARRKKLDQNKTDSKETK